MADNTGGSQIRHMTTTGSEPSGPPGQASSRRFDLLQVHNRYLNPGGEDAVVVAEREVLTGAGHRVELHEVQNPSGPLASATALALSPWNPFSAAALSRVIDSHRPDLAHVHNTWYSLSSSVLSTLRRRRIPTVMTLHNYRVACLNGQLLRDGEICRLCVGRAPLPGIRYRCYRGSLPQSVAVAGAIGLQRVLDLWEEAVDLFVVMSDFSRLLLLDTALPPERIRVKPHFVPDAGARTSPPSSSSTVLFVGRLSAEKGIGMLLDAWSISDTADLTLRIIGDGPLRADVEQRGLARVELAGWMSPDELAKELRSARALLFPSVSYEPFGLVLIEGMAAGMPVVASGAGGIPEVIGDAHPALLPGRGDVAAWSETLSMLAYAGIDLDAVGEANRERYLALYTPTVGLAALERTYAEALERSGR